MKDNSQQFKAGMYLLETLTAGMYNNPLSIYREYIQNCVDSIDNAKKAGKSNCEIKITLDPFEKSILIHDNGAGIPELQAERVLSNIGSSDKIGTEQRGFRGIGRLGGIAFANSAIFRTKASGENSISEQTWDCEKLRGLLNKPSNSPLSLEEVFKQVTTFRQERSNSLTEESFFEVRLEGVESYRNQIFDITKIKKYLSQVAPLPFDPDHFSQYGKSISEFLHKKISNYGEYHITINDLPLYRPYKTEFKITSKGTTDILEDIHFIDLEIDGSNIASGWIGKRRDCLGSISKGEGISGIRIKIGNITIGNEHLLDPFFREERFNSYAIGEIHVNSNKLTPNSRRDDFVDSRTKNLFYNTIEREIGLPISKEIRLRSKLKSGTKGQQPPPNTPTHSTSYTRASPKTSSNIQPPPIFEGQPTHKDHIFNKIVHKCWQKKCHIFKEIAPDLEQCGELGSNLYS